MKKISNILWGLLFIVLGVMLGLNSFGITTINFFFDGWWTLFIIIPSAIELFRSNYKVINLIGIATGISLLLFCQGIFSLEVLWKLALPTILVIIGLTLVFKDAIFGRKKAAFKRPSDKKGLEDTQYATFSNKNIKYDGQVFYGNDLTAVCGSIVCDLRNSIINEDIIINANVSLGNIEILVPDNVNVKTKSTGILGNVTDKRRSPIAVAGPTVYISGMCLLGSVEVK